jgi:hypothetical protein
MNKELRAGESAKAESNEKTVKVSGYAAVFNTEADIGGWYREQIAPGAFTKAIAEDDVRFLINHAGLPLARTKSGTLKLTEDDHGLHIEAELDLSDPDVQSIESKMKRGDLDEMSFAFTPTIEEWDDSGDTALRTIKEAKLYDVAIVTYPAYDDTEIGLRSLENFKKEQNKRSGKAIAVRMKMKLALS